MSEIVKKVQKLWTYGAGRTALATICAHSVSISIGICQGYSAILIPQITRDFHITPDESSWLASMGAVTNPIGSILSGLLAEYLGRKLSILLSSVPFLIGWLCIATARDINLLYVGRLITGVAAGMSVASYTYVAEISTADHRGIFQSIGPICASFGILLTYTLGSFFKWNIVALISILFCIFTMVSMQLVPDSPGYLLKKGRKVESLNSLIWFRRSNAVAQTEFNRLQADSEKVTLRELCLSPSTIKPFFILTTLFLLQTLSGIYTILFYAVNFFQDANLELDENLSSIIVGLIRFTMSIAAAVLINRFERKKLYNLSSGGMAVTMFLAAAYFKYYEIFNNEDKEFCLLPLISVLFNVFLA